MGFALLNPSYAFRHSGDKTAKAGRDDRIRLPA
jgi:hypothetical protein